MEEKTLSETKELSAEPLEKIVQNKTFYSFRSLQDDPLFQKIVQKDLEKMKSRINLDLQDPVWNILLVQSIQGHAQKGHGHFKTCERKYPQATITDVIAAAGMDINTIKAARQELVDEVYAWVNLALNNNNNGNSNAGNRSTKNNNPLKQDKLQLNNKPLLRIKFIENYVVDQVMILKGIVLAGHMDNYQSRMETVNHYKTTIKGNPLEIGGGETYLVDLEMLAESGLNQTFLADTEHDDKRIDYLQRLGVIVDGTDDKENTESVYIRRKIGAGISDDLAMIVIGKKYGVSAMLGAFVIDAIDTYDKCVLHPKEKGLDEVLAAHIQKEWKEKTGSLLASQEEIMEVIYYSAKNNNPKVNVSSSHRRFVQFAGKKIYRPTLQSHIAFVEGRPTEEFPVGFSQMSSSELYQKAQKRINHMLEHQKEK